MPKRTFACDECYYNWQKYTSSSVEEANCPECGTRVKASMPILSETQSNEIIDKNRNIKWKQDQKDLLKERQDEYYWTVMVPKFVREYSLETCLEMGWVTVNEKGEITVNNKPPHKR